jgi:hypothetical protein
MNKQKEFEKLKTELYELAHKFEELQTTEALCYSGIIKCTIGMDKNGFLEILTRYISGIAQATLAKMGVYTNENGELI